MLDHMGFDCADYRRSRRFYEQALAPLALGVVMEVTKAQTGGYEGCGFGKNGKPELWIGTSKGPGSQPVTHSLHVAFTAPDRATVDAFHAAALAAGGVDNGGPGVRPQYHPDYYGAFVFDPDGHNIEAVCHRPA